MLIKLLVNEKVQLTDRLIIYLSKYMVENIIESIKYKYLL